MSEQLPVYIKEIAVVDYKGFRGEHRFSFVDNKGGWCQWTVFLGNNNTGKTNLLKAIASLEPEENIDYDNKTTYYPVGFYKRLISGGDFYLGMNTFGGDAKSVGKLAYLFNNLNMNLVYSRSSAIGNNESDFSNLLIYAYGVIRNIEKTGITSEKEKNNNADNLFYNANLINFEDWLFQLDYGANNPNSENKEKFSRNRNLLKDVLTSEIFPEIKDLRFTSDENLNNYIEFETEDGWHRMSELGYGYQSTLSWMADFCKKLFDRYPDSSNPLKEPAVLLVDEIDLHLHPQWQRELIKSLSDIFPKTQFIVTTHSPFIIQSMEAVNLYTLSRKSDHTEVAHWGSQSYIGWTIEQILSELMGMEGKMHTEQFKTLMNQFEDALESDDFEKGKQAYDALMKILHPQSAERKLLDIRFTQLTPAGND